MELPEAFDADSSHVMPSPGDQRLPHTNSFLARPPANLLFFDAVLPQFRSSTPLHLIANSLKEKRSIPTLHSKRQPKYG
jgi:hypothetical protein